MIIGFVAADVLVSAVPVGGGVWGLDSAEMLLLAGLRGLTMGLLATGDPARQRTAGVLSAFLLVLGTGMAPEGVRPLLLTLGAGAGAALLVAIDAAARQRGTQRSSTSVSRWATAGAVGAVLLTAGLSGTLIRQDQSPSRGLWALLPTSGGASRASEQARSGIGDGPDEVRGGRAPRTSGFDLGEVFVNSDHPGLYDAFIESFGQPVTRSEQMRMIGLRREQILTSDRHTEQDLRSGRSLQLRRSSPPSDGASVARAAGAVLLVGGPTPMRVRMAVYDVYDPTDHAWFETPVPKQNAALYPHTPKPGWMQLVDAPRSPLLGALVRHEIRIGDLETDVLPLPELTEAFKLGRVDRADFFAGGPGHVFRLFRKRLPEGSVLEVLSRPARLESHASVEDPPERLEPLPGLVTDQVRAQVAEWTAGIREAGWDEVRAVVAGLRSHARVGSAASGDGLEGFLLAGRQGMAPDFASAAAVILRSRGYATRLAGGFYARPEAVDGLSGLVRVTRRDAHVWPEVRTRSGQWIPLEPTPGFELAAGQATWGQWWSGVTRATWIAARDTAWVWVPAVALAAVGGWQRRRLWSALATARWWIRPARTPRERVRATLRLLRRRAELAGCGSPVSSAGAETPRQFLLRAEPFLKRGEPDASRLAALADWACYAPEAAPPPRGDVGRVCRWAAGRLTYRHFRRTAAPPNRSISRTLQGHRLKDTP